MRHTTWSSLAFCTAALGVAACSDSELAKICAPDSAPTYLAGAEPEQVGPITAYWDGSESIAGYVDGASANLHPLADVQRLINDHARDDSSEIVWKRFGSKITALPPRADPASTAFYRCGGAKACDNQESRLDDVLSEIANDRSPGLRVIVSDLWLSTSAFKGSTEVALGGPLRRILAGQNGKDQRSIGIIGIRAPYRGPVYEVPNVGTHRGARERPLFVILIGTRREILSAYKSLMESRSPAFAEERVHFSWFGPQPAADWIGDLQQASLSGSTLPAALLTSPETPILQIEASVKDLQSGKAGLSLAVDPAKRVIPGAVWQGQPSGFTRVWRRAGKRCGAGAWESAPPLRGAWHTTASDDGKPGANLILDRRSAADLLPGHTYLVTGSYTTRTVDPNSDATRWMREWSVSPEQAPSVANRNPAFFPALNLGELAAILEKGTQDQQPEGGRPLATFAFILKTNP